jgi:hypothetical protein
MELFQNVFPNLLSIGETTPPWESRAHLLFYPEAKFGSFLQPSSPVSGQTGANGYGFFSSTCAIFNRSSRSARPSVSTPSRVLRSSQTKWRR